MWSVNGPPVVQSCGVPCMFIRGLSGQPDELIVVHVVFMLWLRNEI